MSLARMNTSFMKQKKELVFLYKFLFDSKKMIYRYFGKGVEWKLIDGSQNN